MFICVEFAAPFELLFIIFDKVFAPAVHLANAALLAAHAS